MRKFVCGVCGYEYKEEEERRLFEELPEDWKCPVCDVSKSNFTEKHEAGDEDNSGDFDEDSLDDDEDEDLGEE